MSDEQAVAAVRSVMYQMAERYGAGDVDGVMELFLENGPMNIGTGADEARLGFAGVKRLIARDVSQVDGLAMNMDSLSVNVVGDAAFAFSDVVFTAVIEGERTNYPARSTVGLIRTDAGWRIAQIHTSFAYDGQVRGRSWPVQLTRTLAELLHAVDTEAGSEVLDNASLGTATILFTDIVDSTLLSESKGDQEWSTVINEHFEVTRLIVEAEGGSVVKTLGDGGMYVFPAATSALIAAVRIQQETSVSDNALKLRAGVHTGDVIRGADDYLGLTVNKAARVAAAAEGEQILVSSSTVESVNSTHFEFGAPFTAELKGISGTHNLTPLHWRNSEPTLEQGDNSG
jgi:adenylate cyclase